MHQETGEIMELSPEDHKKLMRGVPSRLLGDGDLGQLIPLTREQERILTPMNAESRKGWMRNQPCICGSGEKFKRCCWSKN